MRKRTLHAIGWAFALLVVVFAARSVAANWSRLRAQPIAWTLRPLPIVGALLLTWLMYALLVQAWRVMLHGWGERLAPIPAARIWTVSSLAKYIPGQLWALAGMAVMAQRAGVAAWAATASSVLLQGLAVGTGAVVLGVTGLSLLDPAYPWIRTAVLVLALASAAGVLLLLWPPFVRRALGLLRVETTGRPTPSVGAVLFGLVANLIAWLGYGSALWLLARGVLPGTRLELAQAIGGYVASYLAGFLALGVPAGVLVREAVFVTMMQGILGPVGALVLALVARLVATAAEFGAAAPFLFHRGEPTRVAT
jgi:hypothetical protein